MNTISWIILAIIAFLLIGVIIYLIKNRKKGCSCCNKDCPYRKSK